MMQYWDMCSISFLVTKYTVIVVFSKVGYTDYHERRRYVPAMNRVHQNMLSLFFSNESVA